MPLEIRRARADELGTCAALFERNASFFHWEAAENLTAEAMLRTFSEEEVYVAVLDGVIVGYLSYYRPDDFVHSLFVERPGIGAGTALLAHVAPMATKPLTLKCSVHNASALGFYDHLGWREVERGETDGVAWLRLQRPQ